MWGVSLTRQRSYVWGYTCCWRLAYNSVIPLLDPNLVFSSVTSDPNWKCVQRERSNLGHARRCVVARFLGIVWLIVYLSRIRMLYLFWKTFRGFHLPKQHAPWSTWAEACVYVRMCAHTPTPFPPPPHTVPVLKVGAPSPPPLLPRSHTEFSKISNRFFWPTSNSEGFG